MKELWFVGFGSFLGGCARYLCALWIERRIPSSFPWGIFLINVAGCFAIGFLSPIYTRWHWMNDSALPLFLSVGVLGGFTTFSSFSLQTLKLMQEGEWTTATAYAMASLATCLIGVFLGYRAGLSIFAR